MQLKLKRLFFKKTLVLSLGFLYIFIGLAIFASPENRVMIIPFFLSFAGFLFFGIHSVFNARRAFTITIAVIFYMLLRYLELRQFFYPLLIIAICIALEIYFRQKSTKRPRS